LEQRREDKKRTKKTDKTILTGTVKLGGQKTGFFWAKKCKKNKIFTR
jgi:hypothetical protein